MSKVAPASHASAILVDPFGRRIDYLRVSVTDRCNFRCVYCMPECGFPASPKAENLTTEELCRVIEAAASLGMRKVRLTGGEPLLLKDLPAIIRRARDAGVEDLSCTTNGHLLTERLPELVEAGLTRLNVSLDTLREDRFVTIARRGSLATVLKGIEQAVEAGLQPLKLNCVLMKGVNSDEVADFARWTLQSPVHVRFIEIMPIRWSLDESPGYAQASGDLLKIQRHSGDMLSAAEMRRMFFSADDAQRAIERELGALQPAEVRTNGPARSYRVPGAPGTVGFISQITNDFCVNCNRLRLTHDGFLRPCLMADGEADLKPALRSGGSIEEVFRSVVGQKPERHYIADGQYVASRGMSQIGG